MPKTKTTVEIDSRMVMKELLRLNGGMPLARMSRHINELTGRPIHRIQLQRLRDKKTAMMHHTVVTLTEYKLKLEKQKESTPQHVKD